MQNLIDLIQSHKIAPVCIRCGSFFRQEFFFCKFCFENQVLKFENFQHDRVSIDPIELTSLFQWVPKTSDSMSLAIHLLKRPESKVAWRFLGKLFANYLKSHGFDGANSSDTVLIPVPGRKPTSVHTQYFCNELEKILKINKVELLQQANNDKSPAQKELSRSQRLTRTFDLCVDFTRASEVGKIQNIVLIDDVITTGATLQACAKQVQALKPKANIRAWVMFKRL